MELERQTEVRPRRGAWVGFAISAALVTGAAIAFATSWCWVRRAPAIPVPAPLEVHVWPAPDEPIDRVEAPVATPARLPLGEVSLDELPGVLTTWHAIAISDRAPTIAVANEREVAISRDDGATWERHAFPKSDGTAPELAVNARGTVFALRVHATDGLGVFAPGEPARFFAAPSLDGGVHWFVAAGSWLALAGTERDAEGTGWDRVLVSSDEGRRFRPLDGAPAPGNAGNFARLDPDGTLWIQSGSEASCGGGGQSRWRVRLDGGAPADLTWPIDTPYRFWLGAKGWSYGVDACGRPGEAEYLCAVGPDPDLPPVAGPRLRSGDEVLGVASNGTTTLAVIDRRLYRARGGAFRLLDDRVPEELGRFVVDREGRLVGLAGGKLVRWSRAAGGWSVILVPIPDQRR